MSKSINDAAGGQFLSILALQAKMLEWKFKLWIRAYTSQDFSNCAEKVPKELFGRTPKLLALPYCNRPNKYKKPCPVGHWILKAPGVRRSKGALKGEAHTTASA